MEFYSWIRRSVSRPKNTTSSPDTYQYTAIVKENQDEELYGISAQLIDFIKSFTIDTFREFRLQEEERIDGKSDRGNVREDLSDWQQKHATLILSKIKDLSQLRFKLCPRYLKEREFWTIYFMLVKSHISESELQSARLAKIKKMMTASENSSSRNVHEVEMLETKRVASEVPSTFSEHSN